MLRLEKAIKAFRMIAESRVHQVRQTTGEGHDKWLFSPATDSNLWANFEVAQGAVTAAAWAMCLETQLPRATHFWGKTHSGSKNSL